jgi:hypothetical protein
MRYHIVIPGMNERVLTQSYDAIDKYIVVIVRLSFQAVPTTRHCDVKRSVIPKPRFLSANVSLIHKRHVQQALDKALRREELKRRAQLYIIYAELSLYPTAGAKMAYAPTLSSCAIRST